MNGLNGVPFWHSTTNEKVTYRPVSHAKLSHAEMLQGRAVWLRFALPLFPVSVVFMPNIPQNKQVISSHKQNKSLLLIILVGRTQFQVILDTHLTFIAKGSSVMPVSCLILALIISHIQISLVSVELCQKESRYKCTHPIWSQTKCNEIAQKLYICLTVLKSSSPTLPYIKLTPSISFKPTGM